MDAEDFKNKIKKQGAGGLGTKKPEPSPADDLAVQELQAGLNRLDELFPAFTPDPQWFERKAAETKANQRSRLMHDLIKLWLAALLLLGLLYVTIAAQPGLFIALQAIAVIAPLVWLLLGKRVNHRE